MTTNELIDVFASSTWEEFLGSFFTFSIIVVILLVIRKTNAGNRKGEDDEDT